jgi:hypothetical protein
LRTGLKSLALQALLFAFLILSSKTSSNNPQAAGLCSEIVESFALDSISNIRSSQEFFSSYLPLAAKRARDFFPVGALYFDTNLDAGIEILGSARTFKLPARLDKLRLNIRIPAFSFTAWVRTSSQFQSGYIIRKQLAPSGLGEHLSVWGWWLRCVGCMWRRCLSVGERMLLSFLFWPPYVKVSTCLCGWTNSGVCVGVQCHIGAESPLWRP